MSTTTTGDKTADFLLRQIRFLRRVGDQEHKRDAARWEEVVRKNAHPEPSVNFATGKKEDLENK